MINLRSLDFLKKYMLLQSINIPKEIQHFEAYGQSQVAIKLQESTVSNRKSQFGGRPTFLRNDWLFKL